MKHQALMDAASEFGRDYGSRADLQGVVRALQQAMSALIDATLSPGQREAKYAQHRELTFNHAGQEPAPRKEPPGEVQVAAQRNSPPVRARGSEADRQGRERHSGRFLSTAHRRST